MTNKRKKRILLGAVLLGVAIAASGTRIRTRTGWQTPVTFENTWVDERSGEIQLRLRLTDRRDGQQRDYSWWFQRGPASTSRATVAVDCGEFKTLRFWNRETGVVWYGHRFKKSTVLGNDESGERGIYRYEITWRTKDLPSPPRPVADLR